MPAAKSLSDAERDRRLAHPACASAATPLEGLGAGTEDLSVDECVAVLNELQCQTSEAAGTALRQLALRLPSPHPDITDGALQLAVVHPLAAIPYVPDLISASPADVASAVEVFADLLQADRGLLVPIIAALAEMPLSESHRSQAQNTLKFALDTVDEPDLPTVTRAILRSVSSTPRLARWAATTLRRGLARPFSRDVLVVISIVLVDMCATQPQVVSALLDAPPCCRALGTTGRRTATRAAAGRREDPPSGNRRGGSEGEVHELTWLDVSIWAIALQNYDEILWRDAAGSSSADAGPDATGRFPPMVSEASLSSKVSLHIRSWLEHTAFFAHCPRAALRAFADAQPVLTKVPHGTEKLLECIVASVASCAPPEIPSSLRFHTVLLPQIFVQSVSALPAAIPAVVKALAQAANRDHYLVRPDAILDILETLLPHTNIGLTDHSGKARLPPPAVAATVCASCARRRSRASGPYGSSIVPALRATETNIGSSPQDNPEWAELFIRSRKAVLFGDRSEVMYHLQVAESIMGKANSQVSRALVDLLADALSVSLCNPGACGFLRVLRCALLNDVLDKQRAQALFDARVDGATLEGTFRMARRSATTSTASATHVIVDMRHLQGHPVSTVSVLVSTGALLVAHNSYPRATDDATDPASNHSRRFATVRSLLNTELVLPKDCLAALDDVDEGVEEGGREEPSEHDRHSRDTCDDSGTARPRATAIVANVRHLAGAIATTIALLNLCGEIVGDQAIFELLPPCSERKDKPARVLDDKQRAELTGLVCARVTELDRMIRALSATVEALQQRADSTGSMEAEAIRSAKEQLIASVRIVHAMQKALRPHSRASDSSRRGRGASRAISDARSEPPEYQFPHISGSGAVLAIVSMRTVGRLEGRDAWDLSETEAGIYDDSVSRRILLWLVGQLACDVSDVRIVRPGHGELESVPEATQELQRAMLPEGRSEGATAPVSASSAPGPTFAEPLASAEDHFFRYIAQAPGQHHSSPDRGGQRTTTHHSDVDNGPSHRTPSDTFPSASTTAQLFSATAELLPWEPMFPDFEDPCHIHGALATPEGIAYLTSVAVLSTAEASTLRRASASRNDELESSSRETASLATLSLLSVTSMLRYVADLWEANHERARIDATEQRSTPWNSLQSFVDAVESVFEKCSAVVGIIGRVPRDSTSGPRQSHVHRALLWIAKETADTVSCCAATNLALAFCESGLGDVHFMREEVLQGLLHIHEYNTFEDTETVEPATLVAANATAWAARRRPFHVRAGAERSISSGPWLDLSLSGYSLCPWFSSRFRLVMLFSGLLLYDAIDEAEAWLGHLQAHIANETGHDERTSGRQRDLAAVSKAYMLLSSLGPEAILETLADVCCMSLSALQIPRSLSVRRAGSRGRSPVVWFARLIPCVMSIVSICDGFRHPKTAGRGHGTRVETIVSPVFERRQGRRIATALGLVHTRVVELSAWYVGLSTPVADIPDVCQNAMREIIGSCTHLSRKIVESVGTIKATFAKNASLSQERNSRPRRAPAITGSKRPRRSSGQGAQLSARHSGARQLVPKLVLESERLQQATSQLCSDLGLKRADVARLTQAAPVLRRLDFGAGVQKHRERRARSDATRTPESAQPGNGSADESSESEEEDDDDDNDDAQDDAEDGAGFRATARIDVERAVEEEEEDDDDDDEIEIARPKTVTVSFRRGR